MKSAIYTHDEAMLILEMFDSVLSEHGICVPSPEDDDRGKDNMVGLYGSTYSDLLDRVENSLIELLERKKPETIVITYEFSGTT